MRTSTSGASFAARSRNSVSGCPRSPRSETGRNVPQWIGTATRGFSRLTALAARAASRWPGPELLAPAGHRDQREVELAADRLHVVEQIGVAGEIGAPRAARRRTRAPGARTPSGPRRPSCSAGVAVTSTDPMAVVSPTSTSVTSRTAACAPAARCRAARSPAPIGRTCEATAGRGDPSARARAGSRRSGRATRR